MYVIRRMEDGKFVARPGMRESYTWFLQEAQVFKTREQAKDCACGGNERVVNLDDILA